MEKEPSCQRKLEEQKILGSQEAQKLKGDVDSLSDEGGKGWWKRPG